MTGSGNNDELEQAKRIMGALVRMPPKPHDQMKLGKPRGKLTTSPKKSTGKKSGKSNQG